MNQNESKDGFVHLHCHSEYSTLDGINRVDTLPSRAKELGMEAVALTDHGNVSGSYRFFKECNKVGVRPIIGMEAYYTCGDRTAKEKDELGESYYHLVLLAQNNTGLHNLFKLSSLSYTEGMYRKPRLDDDLLGQYSEGIIATSACLGSRASQLILRNQTADAERLITHHAQLFKDRFLIELQLHQSEDQIKVNEQLLKVASKHNLPIVLTNDTHYTEQHDKYLHEVALSMQTQTTMSDPKRFSFGDIDVHFASHDWMAAEAAKIGIPYEAIQNTTHVAKMVDSSSYFGDRLNRYPQFKGLDVSSWDTLENLSKVMLTEKFGGKIPPIEYRDRLNYELKVIKRMGFYDYMLIVWEFLNGARESGVWVGPGRGSAAGSLVAYSLGITQMDPIKYGLLFERFLNPGRSSQAMIFDDHSREEAQGVLSGKKTNHHHHHGCGH